jgi:hypothetical protein
MSRTIAQIQGRKRTRIQSGKQTGAGLATVQAISDLLVQVLRVLEHQKVNLNLNHTQSPLSVLAVPVSGNDFTSATKLRLQVFIAQEKPGRYRL